MRVGLYTLMRVLVYVRRISKELQRANDLTELRLSWEHPAQFKSWRAKSGRTIPTTSARLSEISVASVSDWNQRYRELHPDEEDIL